MANFFAIISGVGESDRFFGCHDVDSNHVSTSTSSPPFQQTAFIVLNHY
ncbi:MULTISPECIES: hypothetical protein [unclassified Nostoc]|nr:MULTISPECIES: hypothetical protein [unclassified Nostoc]